MRVWIRRILGPLFEAVVGRLDPTIEIEAHHAFARKLIARWPLATPSVESLEGAFEAAQRALISSPEGSPPSISQTMRATAGWDVLSESFDPAIQSSDTKSPASLEDAHEVLRAAGVWGTNPVAARKSAELLRTNLLADQIPRELAHSVATSALGAHPPREWFLFKRGTYFGSSRLLEFLIRVCAHDPPTATDRRVRESSDPVQRGTVEVLDRLIRHIEVRRGDALRFAESSTVTGDDPFVERMRFAIALIQASDVFLDLRYLNTAMKLVDAALPALTRQHLDPDDVESLRRHLAYLVAFSAQESRLREVFTV